MFDRLSLFDGLSLCLNIDRGVAVCCGNTSVAQPLTDREYVDTRPQQMYRGAVPEDLPILLMIHIQQGSAIGFIRSME